MPITPLLLPGQPAIARPMPEFSGLKFGSASKPDNFIRFAGSQSPADPVAERKALVRSLMKAMAPWKESHPDSYKAVKSTFDWWLKGAVLADKDQSDEYAMNDQRFYESIERREGKELADKFRAKYPDAVYRIKPGGVDTSTYWLAERIHRLAVDRGMPKDMFDTLLDSGLQQYINESIQRRAPHILDYQYDGAYEQLARIYSLQDQDIKPEWTVFYGSPSMMPELANHLGTRNVRRADNALFSLYNAQPGEKYLAAFRLLKTRERAITNQLVQALENNICSGKNLNRLAQLGNGPKVLPTFLKAFQSIDAPEMADHFEMIRGTSTSDDPEKRRVLHSESYAYVLYDALDILAKREFKGLGQLVLQIQPQIRKQIDEQAQRKSQDPFYIEHTDLMEMSRTRTEILRAKLLGDQLPDALTSFERYEAAFKADHHTRGDELVQAYLSDKLQVLRMQAVRGIPGAKAAAEQVQKEVDQHISRAYTGLLEGNQQDVYMFYQINDHFLEFVLENGSAALIPLMEKTLGTPWHPDAVPPPSDFRSWNSPGFFHKNGIPEINSPEALRIPLEFMLAALKGEKAGEMPPFKGLRR